MFRKKVLVIVLFLFIPISAYAESEMSKAGVVFYSQGKYKQALKYLSDAVKNEPDDIKSLYYFANTLVKTYNIDYAKKYYERVIELSSNSDYARLSQIALKDIANNKASIDRPVDSMYVDDGQLFNSENSYINEVLQKGKILHWDKEKMPLKVYLSPPKYKEYNKFVWDAFDDWSKSSRGVVFFDRVENEEEANIVVKWADQFEDDLDDDLYGCSVPMIDGNNLLNYTIYLLNKDYNGEIILPNALYTNALHQIGHCLGINAHSKDDGDLMFIYGNHGELTRRDISTLILLYQQEPIISNFIENSNSVESPQENKISE